MPPRDQITCETERHFVTIQLMGDDGQVTNTVFVRKSRREVSDVQVELFTKAIHALGLWLAFTDTILYAWYFACMIMVVIGYHINMSPAFGFPFVIACVFILLAIKLGMFFGSLKRARIYVRASEHLCRWRLFIIMGKPDHDNEAIAELCRKIEGCTDGLLLDLVDTMRWGSVLPPLSEVTSVLAPIRMFMGMTEDVPSSLETMPAPPEW